MTTEMLTVLEIIKKTTDFFARKEIGSPRLNAERSKPERSECRREDLHRVLARGRRRSVRVVAEDLERPRPRPVHIPVCVNP